MTSSTRRNRVRMPFRPPCVALMLALIHAVACWANDPSGAAPAGQSMPDHDRAIARCTEAIRFDPKNAALYWERAEARWRKARAENIKAEYESGVADCNQAIALDPKDAWAYYIRGKCQPTDFSAAIQDFSTAIRLDPRFAAAYGARGAAWWENARFSAIFASGKSADKQLDRAISDLSEALRLEPKDAGAWYIRGNVWCDKREFKKAVADLGEAVRLEPSAIEYHLSFANALRANGDHDGAVAAYSNVIRQAPENHEALEHRGDMWLLKREYDRAIADYTQAGALVKRREAWRAAGEFGKLLDDLGDAIREHPKGFVAYEEIARLFAACPDPKYRNGQKAVEYARSACDLTNWQNRVTIATLAAAYAECGDFTKAIEWQAKAIDLGGPDSQIQDYHARLELYQQDKPYHERNE